MKQKKTRNTGIRSYCSLSLAVCVSDLKIIFNTYCFLSEPKVIQCRAILCYIYIACLIFIQIHYLLHNYHVETLSLQDLEKCLHSVRVQVCSFNLMYKFRSVFVLKYSFPFLTYLFFEILFLTF